jgi:hypothetical protein
MTTNELQIQIDDAYACPGSCAGCILNISERKSLDPSLSELDLDTIIGRIDEYISTPKWDFVNVTYGIADHLMLSNEWVSHIINSASRILIKNNYVNSGIFFSTALIGKNVKIHKRLEAIHAQTKTDKVNISPIVVLDPKLIKNKKFGDDYYKNIRSAKDIFGVVDLSINMSGEVLDYMTAIELYKFTKDNGFSEITVNWTPTASNKTSTLTNLKGITEFLIELSSLISSENIISASYDPVLKRCINSIMCEHNSIEGNSTSVIETIQNQSENIFYNSLHIDHNLNLYPKFEAIGDVPHSDRFGYKILGNVVNEPIIDIIKRSMPVINQRMMEPFIKNKSCSICKYKNVCSMTGFHVYTKNIPVKEGKCPHLAYDLFEHYYDEMKKTR